MEEEKESGDGERAREGELRMLEKTNRSAASNGSIDLDLLDCTIRMCTVEHVICPSCHDSLLDKDNCHTCTATGGYNRCIALDKILESFCVPCSNAVYGCTVKTLYYKAEDHHNSCPHAPSQLYYKVKYDIKFTLRVKEGTWVLHIRDHAPLFLVKFTPAPPFGNVASVLCVDPHATADRVFRCHLGSTCTAMGQQQSSDFQVRSTNLSHGLLLTENDGSSLFASSTRSITVSIAKIVRDKRKRGKAMRQSILPFVAAS